MKSVAEAGRILDALARQHPNADTELVYHNAFELLVATILSAQTTDVGVNEATPALFARFPDAVALAGAPAAEVERLVQKTGFFRQKTRAIIGMAAALVERHGGQVPAAMDALVQLPGVGRKTANVVLAHALGVPGLPVDRHVLRVSTRIGLAEGDDPEAVETRLCALYPPEAWRAVSDTLILHGRRVCRPKPLCDRCAVRASCRAYGDGTVAAASARQTAPAASRKAAAATKATPAAARRKAPARRDEASAPRRGRTGRK